MKRSLFSLVLTLILIFTMTIPALAANTSTITLDFDDTILDLRKNEATTTVALNGADWLVDIDYHKTGSTIYVAESFSARGIINGSYTTISGTMQTTLNVDNTKNEVRLPGITASIIPRNISENKFSCETTIEYGEGIANSPLNGPSESSISPSSTITTYTFDISINGTIYSKINKTNSTTSFADVSSNEWYYSPITKATSYGLVNGTGSYQNGIPTFNPTGKLTLAQCITLAARMNALINGDTIRTAKSNESWYAPYVEYAENHGLLSYLSLNTTNSMGKYVTRAEFAAIMSVLYGLHGTTTATTPSDAQSSQYVMCINKVYQFGICQGINSKGDFNPNGTLTRAEAATMLLRVIEP